MPVKDTPELWNDVLTSTTSFASRSLADLLSFLDRINYFHTSLTFTLQVGNPSITFLDLTVLLLPHSPPSSSLPSLPVSPYYIPILCLP